MLARDAERQILPFVIIGAGLVLAGLATQFAIGRMMTPSGAQVILWALSGSGGLLLVIALLLVGFYRDPERTGRGGLLSPADGKVILVDERDDDHVGRARRIAIFMSPLDVHVNRVPTSAQLLSLQHDPGGYLPAFRKESERNERLTTLWRSTGEDEDGLGDGAPFKLVQIAGALARRIVPWEKPGARLHRGARYGIIRLGSRVDVYLPEHVEVQVRPGDRVKAGKSVIAHAGKTAPEAPAVQEKPVVQVA